MRCLYCVMELSTPDGIAAWNLDTKVTVDVAKASSRSMRLTSTLVRPCMRRKRKPQATMRIRDATSCQKAHDLTAKNEQQPVEQQ